MAAARCQRWKQRRVQRWRRQHPQDSVHAPPGLAAGGAPQR
eukprot:jgi/Mesen1/2837/ME000174S02089